MSRTFSFVRNQMRLQSRAKKGSSFWILIYLCPDRAARRNYLVPLVFGVCKLPTQPRVCEVLATECMEFLNSAMDSKGADYLPL